MSQNSSMMNINTIANGGVGGGDGDRLSLDRISFGSVNNCDYLDAISGLGSNPAASTIVPSTTGSDTETIVNDNEGASNGSG